MIVAFLALWENEFCLLPSNSLCDIDDINNGILTFREESGPEYKTKFNQLVNAGYLNLFWNFSEKFEVNGGARFEMDSLVLSPKQVLQILNTEPLAFEKFKKAKAN